MAFWIREATLVIGNKKYTLGDLDFKFSIPFDDSDEPPVATVTVTNLSADTRANIKKNDPKAKFSQIFSKVCTNCGFSHPAFATCQNNFSCHF